jgi:hypothetical protein
VAGSFGGERRAGCIWWGCESLGLPVRGSRAVELLSCRDSCRGGHVLEHGKDGIGIGDVDMSSKIKGMNESAEIQDLELCLQDS